MWACVQMPKPLKSLSGSSCKEGGRGRKRRRRKKGKIKRQKEEEKRC